MRVPIVFLFLWALGCSGSPEGARAPEGTGSDGERVVQSQAPQWSSKEGWRVSDDPTTVIGSLTGTDEYQFVEIVDAARLLGGEIAIADVGTKAVRVYEARGAFLRTLGGAGFGPGEFQNPRTVLPLSDGRILVWDGTLFRSTTFGPDGAMETAETLDLATIAKAVEPPLFPGSLEPLPDGGFLVRLVEKAVTKDGSKNGVKTLPSGGFRNRSGALRVSADLLSVDTLMFFPDVEQVVVDAPWGPLPISPPLPRQTWLAHGGTPEVFCIGDQAAPEITCIGAEGSQTLLRWERELGPITDQEIAGWRQTNVRTYGLKLSETDVLRMLDLVPIPDVRPPFSRILLDSSGNLWVNVGPTDNGRASTSDYLVFDPEGAQLGVVTVPFIDVLEIGEDYLMGVYRDELEVEYLHVYSLDRGSAEGLDR